MFLLFMAYAVICLWGIKFCLNDKKYFKDYISKQKSTSIKGIFILLVFFSHFNKYVTYSNSLDMAYFKIVGLVGQIMVVPFLLYSGYGVMESIKKKGDGYISAVPKNRVLKVFLEFAFSVVLILSVKYAFGERFTPLKILLTFLAWESDWYVFAIIFLYLFTYLSFKIVRNKSYLMNIILIIFFTVLYIIIIRNIKGRFWYDTVLCYPLGMLWSLYKDKIEKRTADRLYKWIGAIFIIGGLAAVLKVFGNNALILTLIGFILTGIFIVIVTMRISFNNKVLNWCGTYLFEIYLLHRIPMIVLKGIGFIEYNAPVSFIICLAVTMGLSYVFSKMYKKVWGCIVGQANK